MNLDRSPPDRDYVRPHTHRMFSCGVQGVNGSFAVVAAERVESWVYHTSIALVRWAEEPPRIELCSKLA